MTFGNPDKNEDGGVDYSECAICFRDRHAE
jgi:hypothetical protein